MPWDTSNLSEQPSGWISQADPVSAALVQGMAAGPPPPSLLAEAEGLAAIPDPAVALEAMLPLLHRFSDSERLQLLAVRQLERVRGRAGTLAAWRALLQRFPRNADALLVNLRWTLRNEGPGPAARALAGSFGELPDQAADMLLLARGFEELGERALADAAFERLARTNPAYEAGWLTRIQTEERRGRPWRAQDVAQAGLRAVVAPARLRQASTRLAAEMVVLDAVVSPALRAAGGDVGSLVLARLAEHAAAGRRPPAPWDGAVGPVVMVGSSLGAGGAERQMVNAAIGLHRAYRQGSEIAGRRLRTTSVICRSVEGRPGAGFFAADLKANRVALDCYAGLPEFGGRPESSATRQMQPLLRFLPPRAGEATARLTDLLREMSPGVVHLWQDGTIMACALAALLAGVPRIILSVRTAPPQDRPERDSPEYEHLYPLLAAMPGVVWTTNSRFAAARYAQTIGMAEDRIRVVHNGVAALPSRGSAASRAMLARYNGQHGPGFTVGAVMRMDDNKRPLDFVQCAARLLARCADARFILVGDGPLRAEAEARAAGLGGRMLFTGRSAEVGFWLAEMDALVLLSRVEGLPNVLLEAQLAGVPVVATPAGGSSEALLHARTGFLLGDAATLDRDEIVARLLEIADAGGRRGPMGRAGRRFVAANFSVAAMLEGTVESYAQ